MTAEEIRAYQAELKRFNRQELTKSPEDGGPFLNIMSRDCWLSEIAAQLAEWNERAARQEPTALRIAEKSLAMMERTEKACAKLEE